MDIELKNGMKISGSKEQVMDVLKALGYSGCGTDTFYFSETRGPVAIKDMNTAHLKNAIIKIYREWLEQVSKTSDFNEFKKLFFSAIDDPTFVAMEAELLKRTGW